MPEQLKERDNFLFSAREKLTFNFPRLLGQNGILFSAAFHL